MNGCSTVAVSGGYLNRMESLERIASTARDMIDDVESLDSRKAVA